MARARVMKIDDPTALGRRVAQARKERGMTLRELSFEGCTAAYISTIESGRRVPSLQVLQVLADKLGVRPEFLATGERYSVETALAEAEVAMHLGNHADAYSILESLGGEQPAPIQARATAIGGIIDVRTGNLTEGIATLEAARERAAETFLTLGPAVEALGGAYATIGRHESAVALFSEARDAAVAAGDRPRALKLTVLLANTYIDLGDLNHSTETLATALRDAVALSDPTLRASVLWSQARLHTLEGRQDLAADFARRALDTVRANEDDRAIGLAHQLLAYIELERGEPAHALELLDEGAALIARGGDPIEQAVLELERARALLALGRQDEALALLQQVAPTLTGNTRGNGGRCLVTLAELYESLERPDDALTTYDAAIELLEGHRSPFLARAYQRKGELLGSLNRHEEAYEVLRSALAAQDVTSVHRE